jgi:hypothetical protein
MKQKSNRCLTENLIFREKFRNTKHEIHNNDKIRILHALDFRSDNNHLMPGQAAVNT